MGDVLDCENCAFGVESFRCYRHLSSDSYRTVYAVVTYRLITGKLSQVGEVQCGRLSITPVFNTFKVWPVLLDLLRFSG